MRTFKTTLVTLAASAAILVPAATAAADAQSTSRAASSSALASTSLLGGCQILCFNTYIDDVLSGNDVDIITAVSFCGVQIAQLQVLGIGQSIICADGHKKVKRSK